MGQPVSPPTLGCNINIASDGNEHVEDGKLTILLLICNCLLALTPIQIFIMAPGHQKVKYIEQTLSIGAYQHH